ELHRFPCLVRVEVEIAPARTERGVIRRLLHRLPEQVVRSTEVAERARRFGANREIVARAKPLIARRRGTPLAAVGEPVTLRERLRTLAVLDRQAERSRREHGEEERKESFHDVDR